MKSVADKTPCDDGVGSATTDMCLAGACTSTDAKACNSTADCGKFEDGNLCNGTLFCDKVNAKCALDLSTIVACPTPDNTACKRRVCAPKTGACPLVAVNEFGACDDGNKFTVGDHCSAGECVSGTDVSACSDDSDCAKLEDGNACNGSLFCDKSKGSCVINPKTLVTCSKDQDTACLQATCQPTTGSCALVPTAGSCDDDDKCTQGDHCVGGACAAGKTLLCACATDADCAGKDDGDKCNGTQVCDRATAVPKCVLGKGTVVFCPKTQDSAWLQNRCAPKTGLCAHQPTQQGTACDDGDACTKAEACDGLGVCAGATETCDDGDKCTLDGCHKASGCLHAKKVCADGNSCTVDTCNAASGECVFPKEPLAGKPCADGDGCTVLDVCTDGVCAAGPAANCTQPTEPCLQRVCAAGQGEQFVCVLSSKPKGAASGDSEGCVLGDHCEDGTCKAGKVERLYVGPMPDSGGSLRLYAVAAASGGAAVVGGGLTAAGQTQWWVRRSRPDRQADWTVKAAGSDLAATAVRGVALSGSDVVLAAGVRKGSGGVGRASLARIKAGKLDWQQDYAYGDSGAAFAVAVDAVGTGVIAGSRQLGGVDSASAIRFSSAGKVIWHAVVGGTGEHRFTAAALRSGGRAVLAGHAGADSKGGGGAGWLLALTADGKVQWQHRMAATAGQALNSIAAETSGGWLAAGWQVDAGGKRHPWLLRADAGGVVGWQDRLAPVGEGYVALPLGASDVVVAGATDATGNYTYAGERQLLLVRSDAWGHAPCDGFGACKTKTAASCNDNQACTLDRCDAEKGCVHTAISGCP